MPISGSWILAQRFSVQLSPAAAISAAVTAVNCTSMPPCSQSIACAAITPSPATCAMARSMKMIPRLSTSCPSGTWVLRTIKPAASAGPMMVKSNSSLIANRSLQSVENIVEQCKQILRALGAAHRQRQHNRVDADAL